MSCGQRLLGAFALDDIPKYEHNSGDLAGLVLYGRTAVVNRNFCTVPPDKDGVVGKADNISFLQDLMDGVFSFLTALLVNYMEHLRHRL